MESLNKFQKGQLICIDKPLTWTSFDVVKRIRWLIRQHFQLKKLKVGHAGTLDPLATGLLIICTGKYTKQIDQVQAQEKEYQGIITLGATTPSFDLEKEIDEAFDTNHLTINKIKDVATSMIGEQLQIAPIHSAKKVDGQRAYDLARQGKDVEIKSSLITIKEFEVELTELPQIQRIEGSRIHQATPYNEGVHVHFRIVCSKGTYIRSIARDLGEKLNCGGHLSQLIRTRIGDYRLEDGVTLEQFEKELNLLSK